MSYQVLARKWRPRSFPEMVGQEHVLRALINALDNDRLHHAFLFTGTRGVGKTTIARLLAKSLNCEKGPTSSPCGECSACREIDEGRFVDLIEVDAASRTKVEDTRELLDNVQYAPTRARYKVYLVDEVHMLSTHSFNALLKTLEEPPPHVKFLLATTDPQKLPVTILSRCLQFNLKRLPLESIRDHLARIMEAEGVESEPAALTAIARAADGSMRDALSLLDQAIAFGGGRLGAGEVREMLGTIDRDRIFALLDALADREGARLLAEAGQLAEQAPDFAGVLTELNSTLHRVALVQAVPEAGAGEEAEAVSALARRLAPEDVQLFYQIGIIGTRDLPLAPDPRTGFEMVLLRMLAFRPEGDAGPGAGARKRTGASPAAPAAPARSAESARPPVPAHESTPESSARESRPTLPAEPPRPHRAPEPTAEPAVCGEPATRTEASRPAVVESKDLDWPVLAAALPLAGMSRQLAMHCTLASTDREHIALVLSKSFEQLLGDQRREALRQALEEYLGRPLRLTISVGEAAGETPNQVARRRADERQQTAEAAFAEDPNVQGLVERFDGEIVAGSVRPID